MDESKQSRQWIGIIVLVLAIAGVAFFVSSRQKDSPTDVHGPIVSALENLRRAADAERVRAACKAGPTCACRQEAARRALDRNLHAEATAALAGDAECEKTGATRGLLAEAATRAGQHDDAIARATEVLGAEPGQPFAEYALAHAHYAKGDVLKAAAHAQVAADRGRGAAAHLLLGLIAYRANDLARAKAEFEKMLAEDRDDVDALYNLALLASRENRYRDAREGYLRVLQLDPKHLDARYNLGLLTHGAGATAEAQHHLQKLEAMAPKGDERVTKLRVTLATPAPGGGTTVAGRADAGR